jgi:hypothetical protein
MSNVNLSTYINEYVKNTIPLSPIPLVSIPTVQNKCITYEVMSKTVQTEYYGDHISYKSYSLYILQSTHYKICNGTNTQYK